MTVWLLGLGLVASILIGWGAHVRATFLNEFFCHEIDLLKSRLDEIENQ